MRGERQIASRSIDINNLTNGSVSFSLYRSSCRQRTTHCCMLDTANASIIGRIPCWQAAEISISEVTIAWSRAVSAPLLLSKTLPFTTPSTKLLRVSAIPSEKSFADDMLSYERPVRAEHRTNFPFVFEGQRIDDYEAKHRVLSIVLPVSWDESRSMECLSCAMVSRNPSLACRAYIPIVRDARLHYRVRREPSPRKRRG